jgi:hypothetical protein
VSFAQRGLGCGNRLFSCPCFRADQAFKQSQSERSSESQTLGGKGDQQVGDANAKQDKEQFQATESGSSGLLGKKLETM